jgi:hypothetical protein
LELSLVSSELKSFLLSHQLLMHLSAGFLSCRERKGDFSCLTAARICEASTSDAVVQAAGTAMPVPLAPYPTPPVPFTPPNGMDSNLALQEHSYFFSFFSPDVGWSPENVGLTD